MRLLKPCLIVSDTPEQRGHLSNIMLKNRLFFSEQLRPSHLEEILSHKLDTELILIDSRIKGKEAADIRRQYPDKVIVVIDQEARNTRSLWMREGIDEVLTQEDLESDLAGRLIEKLIEGKRLTDAEARIEQSEERFRGIIEYAHDMILLLDRDATIVYTSPAFGRQMQFQSWEVLGSVLFDFVNKGDIPHTKNSFEKILKSDTGDTEKLEFRIRRNDGSWRNVEAMASNLLSNNTVGAVVLNFRDVTRQKEAERELELHQKDLEALVEIRTKEAEKANRRVNTFLAASPDTLIVVDDNGYISFASEHYRQRYPREANAFQAGMHILDAFDVIARNVFLSRDDPRYEDMRSWWQKPTGTREFRLSGGVWTRLQAKPVPGSSEIVITTTDITDYKRQQARLAAQSADLTASLLKEKEIVEQQKTFVSMVSHEFRTPLTVIDGNAQIIQKRGATIGQEALAKRATTIRSGVDRLVRLIETILSAHMLDSGKLAITREVCDISSIIHECCADQQDIAPNHRIISRIENLPKKAMLDAKVMRQMMTNLLSNAVKYAPDQPEITVVARQENNAIIIEVSDKGVGIPEDELPRIFGKYFRASTSGGIPGSGLGLSLVKQLVELHNGSITLQSKLGQGTSINVVLPIILP